VKKSSVREPLDLQNVGGAYESVNKLKLGGCMKNLLDLCYPFSNSLSFIIYFPYREFMSSEVHLESANETSGWIQIQDA